MFKIISAALVAVSVLAAPALAATHGKTINAPVIKAGQTKVLDANARMGRHPHKHYRHHRNHRHHRHMGALKTHAMPKSVLRHVVKPAPKRG